MGLFSVFRVLPWAAILANGPAIVRAADGLLSRSEPRAAAAAAAEARALADRLQALEATQVELAELFRRMADQTERLTTAVDLLAARVRWLTITAVAAAVLAVISLILAVTLR